jgi:hypothetical protein
MILFVYGVQGEIKAFLLVHLKHKKSSQMDKK